MIALGRLMLATLFLIAIALDSSQPTHGPVATFAVLGAYLIFAAALLLATWDNWWLDAKLAGPAHAVDILLFTLLVLLTEGYTSPYFTFFMFLLLAAAIRWSWHVTALTAMLLTVLYLLVGMLVVKSGAPFEPQRFAVRTGHLVILSLILIWFGANQWRARFYLRDEELLARPSLDESPLETGLRAAMNGVRASAGMFVWRNLERGDFTGIVIRDGQLAELSVPGIAMAQALVTSPFLYDFGRNRALRKDADRNLIDVTVRDLIVPKSAPGLVLGEGLAIPVHSDGGEGEMFLEGVPSLSTDHIDLGEQIATDVAVHLQRHAMLTAAEDSAEARSRLTLARDLHDSIVQFLAGAAFRLEAIKRSSASGRAFEPELDELKQLMLQEQRELRSVITALRSGPLVAFNDLVKDLVGLAGRLARQWDIACDVTARPAELSIPIRLHLDAQQLMREAVANAVRHADSKSVTVEVAATAAELRLVFVNDVTATQSRSRRLDMPQSLKERVDEAGGTLEMARGMGVTKVSIALPIGGRRA
ncbi:histidine kinase [Sphingomonas sp.]|uniref:sensor histidine kinase n=1 Tax=Sphingomonas sp. TaxID=28214 RepID=UPI00286B76CF|nr:histidine kinase [Sphingomonas sp.]